MTAQIKAIEDAVTRVVRAERELLFATYPEDAIPAVKSAKAALAAAIRDAIGSGELVARIEGIDEYGPRIEWMKHWVDVGAGARLYAHAQPVQPDPSDHPRAAFEHRMGGANFKRDANGNYVNEFVRCKWWGWCAHADEVREPGAKS